MSIDRLNGIRVQIPGEFGVRSFTPPRVEVEPEGRPGAEVAGTQAAAGTFEKAVVEAVDAVNTKQLDAEAKIAAFVRGEDVPLHEVVLAQEEAEISFRLMLEVRDKLLQAYQDVMRTPL